MLFWALLSGDPVPAAEPQRPKGPTEHHCLLEEWAVVHTNRNPYGAPESRGISLMGVVMGHPRKPNGKAVVTSSLAKCEGRCAITSNGTLYWLGEPSVDYRKWLSENYPKWDPENPISFVSSLLEP